jgi:hypothetical protein
MPWTPSPEFPAQAVVAQMQGVHFSAAGSNRSYGIFTRASVLAISALLTVQAVLLWQLAGTARATWALPGDDRDSPGGHSCCSG